MRIGPLFILTLLSFSTLAQKIENLQTIAVDETIEITFDLIDEKGNQTFDLQLFSSHDGYASALINVTGDVGEEVTPGINKKVIWEAKTELGDFKGEIYLEVRGIVTPPFVRILTPNAGDKFKPGKTMEIQWDSGVSGDIGIDLYRNGSKVSTVATTPNTGNYSWTLSKGTAKQDGYYLVFSTNAKPGKTMESQQFVVSGGVPIWAIAGVVVVGGVVAVLVSGGEGEPPPNGTTDDDIPDPIKPGGG